MAAAEDALQALDVAGMAAQMNQIDVGKLVDADSGALDPGAVESFMQDEGVGSVLNSPFSIGWVNGSVGWTAAEWRQVVTAVNEAAQRHGVPPVLFGLDSIHGASYVKGSVLFPQQLNLAATFDRDLVRDVGHRNARATLAAGIPWLFSPVVGVLVNPLWSRTYETFGEDPWLAGRLAASYVQGVQTPISAELGGSGPLRAAACPKHFIGYPSARSGHDRSPSWVHDRILHEYFVPPFREAFETGGALTLMEAYHEIAGVPLVASRKLLSHLLRGTLDFRGMLVTDYQEIQNQIFFHRTAADLEDATLRSLERTSIDMSMVPNDASFRDTATALVEKGLLPRERIEDSARRILWLKDRLGLLEQPLPDPSPPMLEPTIAAELSQNDSIVAMGAARASVVLLKNDDETLPLPLVPPGRGTGIRIAMVGPTCDSIAMQTGGWSLHWQGATDGDAEFQAWDHPRAASLLGGLAQAVAPPSFNESLRGSAQHFQGAFLNGSEVAIPSLAGFDAAVVCIGEGTYTEKPGDIVDLALPAGQRLLPRRVRLQLDDGRPLVLVYVGGRPRIISEAVDEADAFVHVGLPGPTGGIAVAAILLDGSRWRDLALDGTQESTLAVTGVTPPSGRLPFTWPRFAGAVAPYWDRVTQLCTDALDGSVGDPHGHAAIVVDGTSGLAASGPGPGPPQAAFAYSRCPSLFHFGSGLTYSRVTLAGLELQSPDWESAAVMEALIAGDYGNPALDWRISFSASSSRDDLLVDYIALGFIFVDKRDITPEYKRLAASCRLENVGRSAVAAHMNFSTRALAFVGEDSRHSVLQDKLAFSFGIGSGVNCRQVGTNGEIDENCSRQILDLPPSLPSPQCTYACRQWSSPPVYVSDMQTERTFEEAGCDVEDPNVFWEAGACIESCRAADIAWDWNYVHCVEESRYDGLCDLQSRCRTVRPNGEGGIKVLRASAPWATMVVVLVAAAIGAAVLLQRRCCRADAPKAVPDDGDEAEDARLLSAEADGELGNGGTVALSVEMSSTA